MSDSLRNIGQAAARNNGPMPLLIGGMLAASLIGAFVGQLHRHTDVPGGGVMVHERNLLFADAADGGVRITDADSGVLLRTVEGQAGFLRGTLRGLASARKHAGIAPSVPFRLAAWQDGRLTLDDPSTHRHVELEAFGRDNEAVFAALLP